MGSLRTLHKSFVFPAIVVSRSHVCKELRHGQAETLHCQTGQEIHLPDQREQNQAAGREAARLVDFFTLRGVSRNGSGEGATRMSEPKAVRPRAVRPARPLTDLRCTLRRLWRRLIEVFTGRRHRRMPARDMPCGNGLVDACRAITQ